MSIGGTLCVSTDHSAIQQLPGGPLLAGEGPEVPARSWGHRGQGRRRGGASFGVWGSSVYTSLWGRTAVFQQLENDVSVLLAHGLLHPAMQKFPRRR